MFTWWKIDDGESGSLAGQLKALKLVEPLLGKGYVVYIHNLYTSPDLVVELKLVGTGATGTVRSNRKNLPPNLKNFSFRKGEPAKYWSTDHMAAFVWHDVKHFHVLSSIDNIGATSTQVHTTEDLSTRTREGWICLTSLKVIAITLSGSKSLPFLY